MNYNSHVVALRKLESTLVCFEGLPPRTATPTRMLLRRSLVCQSCSFHQVRPLKSEVATLRDGQCLAPVAAILANLNVTYCEFSILCVCLVSSYQTFSDMSVSREALRGVLKAWQLLAGCGSQE